jgi:hypothetical protein
MIVSCQYRAHAEPPLYSTVRAGTRRDSIESQLGKPRGRPTTDEVVDPLLARPGQPAVPERPYLGRLGHTDRQEVQL